MDNARVTHRQSVVRAADSFDPSAYPPNDPRALEAVGGGVGGYQLAWPFVALRDENVTEFIDRWANWFAHAHASQLRHPSTMPERSPEGSYRRGR